MTEPIIKRKFQYTDLKDNSNKWWQVEYWADGQLKASHGRVGWEAVPTIKQGQSQSEVDRLVREKLKKGYREIELLTMPSTPVPSYTFDSTVSKYVNDLLFEAGEAIKSYLSISLDGLSKTQIDKGRDILKQLIVRWSSIKVHMNNSRHYMPPDDIVGLVEEYYRTIPTQLPNKIDVVDVVHGLFDDFNEQETRLDQLEAAVANMQPSTTGSPFNPFGQTKLEFLPSNSVAYRQINDYVRQSSQHRILDILQVEIPHERTAFDGSNIGKSNVSSMFHGTRNPNGVHILRKGLIIPQVAANGSRFGRGIYFADQARRSINYTGYSSRRFRTMFICDVALGNQKVLNGDDGSLKSAPSGYDSVWGKQSYSGMDEFIVYRPEQQTIRAVVFLEG